MTWENVGYLLLGAAATAFVVVAGLITYFWGAKERD